MAESLRAIQICMGARGGVMPEVYPVSVNFHVDLGKPHVDIGVAFYICMHKIKHLVLENSSSRMP